LKSYHEPEKPAKTPKKEHSRAKSRGPLHARLKVVLKDTGHELTHAELPLAASSLAYTTILSGIPRIAVSFSIFKAVGGLEKLYAAIEPFVFENLAEGADERTLETIRSFVTNIHAGTLGVTGFLGLIFTSMLMLSSIEKSINRVWKTHLKRSLFQRVVTYWFFITLGPIGAAAALGFTASIGGSAGRILPPAVLLFPILVGMFFGMYKFIPHRKVHWQPALIAAFWTSLSWLIAKGIYSVYVKYVVSYDKIYGSLGAVPILLVWIYVAWLVVLAGAALSAALQRRVDFP